VVVEPVTFVPIGWVENKFDSPTAPEMIRASESRIVLNPALTEGLTGLEPGMQIIVIYCFHLSTPLFRESKGHRLLVERDKLLQHPRGDRSRPKQGVFALCTPHRPNPIGVTMVELLSVEGNVLRVRGLDALNGSPVLDIKPA